MAKKTTKKLISKKVRKSVLDYLNHLKKDGLSIDRAFIFGSYAKGTKHKWSDIDVCIVSSNFRGKIDPLEYLWINKRNQDTQAMISPVGFHPKDFVNENPLVWEVKQHGLKVI